MSRWVRRRLDAKRVEHRVEGEVDLVIDAFSPKESVNECPIEAFLGADALDVGEAQQIREPILVQVDKEVHQRDLRIDHLDRMPVRQLKGDHAVPYQVSLSQWKYLELEQVHVQIHRDTIDEEIDGLQVAAIH